ncbi:MAG: Holliday junction branch migration protein RuvA [Chitinophagaceae bacterium]|nr:Holliday junction branch migration protein RuvA [Chitinophagaceae bacterium]MBN8668546.1 Holliday junction branch migration protein RuvA [Chitinophagales bacterium]
MIAFLRGRFVQKSPALVHVDVQGVGYEVHISLNTFTRIQDLEEGQLYTSLLIREDAHILFGFYELAEKEMFMALLGVSGVGAATARMVLSYLKPDEFSRAILAGDVKTLESIKGIGKKTAERLVLELKDKLAKNPAETSISPMKHNTLHADALNALIALGIGRNTAEQAVQKVIQSLPSNTSVEEVIKKALKTV